MARWYADTAMISISSYPICSLRITHQLPLLVYLYPVYAQFRRQLFGLAYRADPLAAELVGEDDVEGTVSPRELIFLSL